MRMLGEHARPIEEGPIQNLGPSCCEATVLAPTKPWRTLQYGRVQYDAVRYDAIQYDVKQNTCNINVQITKDHDRADIENK